MPLTRRLLSNLTFDFTSSSSGLTATATPSSNSHGVIYTIQWGDGVTTTSTEVPSSHHYTYAGSYIVQMDAVDSWGNVAASVWHVVTVSLPLAAPYYDPASYVGGGYTFGLDISGDMTAINAAAADAMAAYGTYGAVGTLALMDRTYLYAENAAAVGGYGNFNTHIVGLTPGFNWTLPIIVEGGDVSGATFKLGRLPVFANLFIGIHLGKGYRSGISPTRNWNWSDAQWDDPSVIAWTSGYILRNLHSDCSLLSNSDLTALSPNGAATGGFINASGIGSQDQSVQRALVIENISGDVAWGSQGLVSGHARWNQVIIRDITVTQAMYHGVWFDAGRQNVYDGITVQDRHALSPIDVSGGNNGINLDYGLTGDHCTTKHLNINNMQVGWALNGNNSSVEDSIIILPSSGTTNSIGIAVGSGCDPTHPAGNDPTHAGAYPSSNNRIVRCHIYRAATSGAAAHYAIQTTGVLSNSVESKVSLTDMENNVIGEAAKKTLVGYQNGSHTDANTFINNDVSVSFAVTNGANGDDVITPNTVH